MTEGGPPAVWQGPSIQAIQAIQASINPLYTEPFNPINPTSKNQTLEPASGSYLNWKILWCFATVRVGRNSCLAHPVPNALAEVLQSVGH